MQEEKVRKKMLIKNVVLALFGFGAGMGLPNMKSYTDSMQIDTEIGVGTKITMTVNL